VKRSIALLRITTRAALAFALLLTISLAQEATPTTPSKGAAPRDLDSQVRELRAAIDEMRIENAESRSEMHELRQELQATRKLLGALAAPTDGGPSPSPAGNATVADSQNTSVTGLGSRVQKLEESTQLLGSKIDEQYQTKVETAAKYRARLSGIVLMNAFHNVGASDNLDFPNYARPVAPGNPQASVGATLRQTEIGLEIFGPTVAGAKSSASVQFDFGGGFPSTPNGVNFGIARMQTASLRLDWKNTSVIAGQDSLFISPLSPTSFASLATPAFAYAGNLWGWTPQIRVEHRFDLSNQQTITLQAGLLDNLTWEPPYNSFYRSAQAGEQSGRPAYALRSAWSRPVFDHPLSFAVAGYYGRQNWSWDRYVDGWAGMTDWQIPILRRLTLSGEFYRGRGVGGLGAGIGRAVLFGGDPSSASTRIRGLDSAGGWGQLKFQLTMRLPVMCVASLWTPITSRRFSDETAAHLATWCTGHDPTCCFPPNSDDCTAFRFIAIRARRTSSILPWEYFSEDASHRSSPLCLLHLNDVRVRFCAECGPQR
jgi:prefoldin subunit 5